MAIIQIFGISDQTATIAGLIIGILATLTVPATYALIRTLLGDKNAAFVGCILLALSPGMVLMFPVLDQIYPAMTCLIVISWLMALRTAKPIWAIAFGVILSAACFVVYHFLVLGVFLSIATIAHVAIARRERLRPTLRMIGIAILSIVLIYLILYGYAGFNAIAVFKTALVEQQKHLASLVRPYPRTILFDLTDFAMGAAWLPVALGLMWMLDKRVDQNRRAWGLLCFVQIVILAVTGLMQGETARIWLFLLPLLIVPAAMELSSWPRKSQITVYLAMWLLLCLVGQNMAFMY